MKQMKIFLLVVTLFCLCVACARKQDPALGKVAEDYCSTVQAVYSSLNLGLLQAVATENEGKRIFPVVQALQAADNVMKSEILQFKVQSAANGAKAGTATVETREKWRFWWEDRKTGAITKGKKEESYHLRYSLVKVGPVWKVDSVRNI